MLTTEKLKAMQPGEIFAQGEGIDDGKIFNIWGEGWKIQRVAVRGQGYHDRAIYYHLYSEEKAEKMGGYRYSLLLRKATDWNSCKQLR